MSRRTRKLIVWLLALLIVIGLGFTVRKDVGFTKGSSENYALPAKDQQIKNGILVFCYHRVLKNTMGVDIARQLSSNSQLHDFEVPLNQFKEQMAFLHRHHITVLSAHQMTQRLTSGVPLKGKYAVLTFDDIDRSTIDNAIPVMKQYHMPFTTFIITGNTGWYREGTQLATWSQIREARRSANGLMTLGLHTNNMHYLSKTFEPIFDYPSQYHRFTKDFATSRRVLRDHTGVEADSFAFPYGTGPNHIVRFLSQQNLSWVATLDAGIATKQTDLMETPRMIINSNSWPSIERWYQQ